MSDLRFCPVFKAGYRFPANPSLDPRTVAWIEGSSGNATVDELVSQAIEEAGFAAALELRYVLELCRKANVLDYAVRHQSGRIAWVRPFSGAFEFRKGDASGGLSRFAVLRRENSSWIVESPLVAAVVELASPGISLEDPRMVELLGAAGFLETAEESAGMLWEFHDALFHARSRLARGRRVGATWRFADRVAPPSEDKTPMSERSIPLAVADDTGEFQTVLENRRSRRTPGSSPLTLEQLGEFLYRAVAPRADSRRVYPSGGGLHELEFYLTVRDCDGLAPGFYHYRAADHALESLASDAGDVAAMLANAVAAWGGNYPAPNVLITFAARVPRVSFKYEAMAYRVVLLNAGCVFQTMNLVATAMNLAACAIGNGDPELFQKMTGIDFFEETSVGEFALSSGDDSLR